IRPGSEASRQTWRMVQRLGRDSVVLLHSARRVRSVRKHPAALAERFRVEPDERVAESDVALVVTEVAVDRAAWRRRRAGLVNQPRRLARRAREVGRKLRRDDEVDRPSVALAEIQQAPCGGMRQDLLLRIPLERDADELRLVSARDELAQQLADVN